MISSHEKKVFGSRIINFGSTLIVPCLTTAFSLEKQFPMLLLFSHILALLSHDFVPFNV